MIGRGAETVMTAEFLKLDTEKSYPKRDSR